jgi:hypothetical protein
MNRFLNVFRKVILYTWTTLTIAVGFLLIIRTINPQTKGISNVDLKFYVEITLYCFIIYSVLKLLENKIKE